MDMSSEESFAEQVRDKLAFLISEHAFSVVREDKYVVLLESPMMHAEAIWDQRGEVTVNVYRRAKRDFGMWSYSGFEGRASVPRLLEIAADQMQEDARVLDGDTTYYDALATEQKASAEAWTAYYSQKGPKPDNHWLP